MSIVLKTDFVGDFTIPQDTFSHLELFIVKYEKFYLIRLLGAELYKLFLLDLDNNTPQQPTSLRFQVIFNTFDIDRECELLTSEGIKKLLVKFIYFHYISENQLVNTTTGTVRNNPELGVAIPFNNFVNNVYNIAVNDSIIIQDYMAYNEDVYPEKNPQKISLIREF